MPKSTPDIIIDISRLAKGWPDVEIRAALDAALVEVDRPNRGELSIVLSDDAHIRDLNRNYRGKDRSTNVLSFPMPTESGLMGDVVFARETLEREAVEQGKSFTDHFTHLLIHGILHLQGLDHQTEAEAEDMEAREVRALARLLIDNPYMANKG